MEISREGQIYGGIRLSEKLFCFFILFFSKTRLISSESWVEEGVGGVCVYWGEAVWLASHRQLDSSGPAGVRVLGYPE